LSSSSSAAPASGRRSLPRQFVKDGDTCAIKAKTVEAVAFSPDGRHLLSVNECQRVGKPHLVIDLADERNLTAGIQTARDWIAANVASSILNVAGPRASKHPTVYERARAFLRAVLAGRLQQSSV
jgi:hypothetical protein